MRKNGFTEAALSCIGLLMLFASASAPAAQAQGAAAATAWRSIGGTHGYAVAGSGNALADGAEVSVESTSDAPGDFGGAIAHVDATPWRGRQVALSAVVDAMSGARDVALWLRADGPTGRKAFSSSANNPVTADKPERREVRVTVPGDALELVFGLTMKGQGRAVATELRIGAANDAMSADAALIEAAIAIVKEHALNADKVDWARVEPRLAQFVRPADGSAAAYPAIRALLGALGDGHSFLATPQQAARNAVHGRPTTPPVVRQLDAGIGYVLVPGFTGWNPADSRAFASSILQGIEGVEAPRGWVLDLRENSGGNMWPMLAALAPFLGPDTPVGAFQHRDGKARAWTATTNSPGGTEGLPDLTGSKVAVLVDGTTASSGEAVYVAFRGRPRTRSFGQPTAGQSSSNQAFDLPDGSAIFLTTAIDVDRNGVAYGGVIVPDEVIEDRAGGDAALDAARTWLLGEEGGQPP